MTIVHDDDDIVVVDKPVGVAAHPTSGWTGPTVVGGLAAAGYRIATSGAAERQGIVHAARRRHVGPDGGRKSERAYSVLKHAFQERTVDKTYHALVQGHPDPLRGTIDAPIGRHPGHDYKFAVMADGKHSVTHYETLEAHPVRVACSRSTSRPAAPTRSGCTWPRCSHPCVGDLTYGADPTLAARLGLRAAVAARRPARLRAPRHGRVRSSSRAPTPRTCATRPRPRQL